MNKKDKIEPNLKKKVRQTGLPQTQQIPVCQQLIGLTVPTSKFLEDF